MILSKHILLHFTLLITMIALCLYNQHTKGLILCHCIKHTEYLHYSGITTSTLNKPHCITTISTLNDLHCVTIISKLNVLHCVIATSTLNGLHCVTTITLLSVNHLNNVYYINSNDLNCVTSIINCISYTKGTLTNY